MTDRRHFFYALFRGAVETYGSLKGKPPENKLSDIYTLPMENLLRVVPVMRCDILKVHEDGSLTIVDESGGEERLVYMLEGAQHFAFAAIDGKNDLRRIAEAVQHQSGLSFEQSVEMCKQLFFNLSRMHLCLPADMV